MKRLPETGYSNQSHAGQSSQILEDDLDYQESLEIQDFPISESEIREDDNIETKLHKYRERLEEHNYLVIESEGEFQVENPYSKDELFRD